jgi:hypothetical protein
MRKKLLVMGVVVIALISFSGIVSSSVYMQYWETMNSKGWMYFGELVPDYTFYGKYNYNDHMVWKEFDGEIYMPTHENWHINWDTKTLYKGKPSVIVHYNFMYHVEFTPKRIYEKFYGYLHLTDPAAGANRIPQWELYLWDLMPAITKIKFPKGYPTIEDTAKLVDWVFENFDYTLIPLIDRIELFGIGGNVLTIDVSLIK